MNPIKINLISIGAICIFLILTACISVFFSVGGEQIPITILVVGFYYLPLGGIIIFILSLFKQVDWFKTHKIISLVYFSLLIIWRLLMYYNHYPYITFP